MQTILLFLFLTLNFGLASAQEKCSQQSNLKPKNIQELCDVLNKENSAVCSKGSGRATLETLPTITYGIFSAKGQMTSLFKKLESLQQTYLKDKGGCPEGCSKVGAPVVEIKTIPSGFSPHASCPSQYTEINLNENEQRTFAVGQAKGLTKSFSEASPLEICQQKGSEWAQEVLMGDNKLGQFLEKQKCPSPCSYSSVIRLHSKSTRVSSQCAVDVELVVLCGPPKKDREWKTTASIEKAYLCEAPQ